MNKYSTGTNYDTELNSNEVQSYPTNADDGYISRTVTKTAHTTTTTVTTSAGSSSSSPRVVRQQRRSIISSNNKISSIIPQKHDAKVHPIQEDDNEGQGKDFLLGTIAPAIVNEEIASSMDAESMSSAKLLLNYLVAHKNRIEDSPELLKEFEELTKREMSRFPDKSCKLTTILHDAGWSENGFQLTLFRALDEEDLAMTLGMLKNSSKYLCYE
jgi:hypothetical protein